MKRYTFKGKVEVFPQKGRWFYIKAPKKYVTEFEKKMDRGLVPIKATVGKTTWNTSLLPYGNGTLFLALPAKVRKENGIEKGSSTTAFFTLR